MIHEQDLQYAMQVATVTAQRSRATRARVGCVIWDLRIRSMVSMGYNGTPAGTSNVMEQNNTTLPQVIHAEDNALRKIKKFTWFRRPYIMVVTHMPCVTCSRLICSYPIQQVYYMENYGNHEGAAIFAQQNIPLTRVLYR